VWLTCWKARRLLRCGEAEAGYLFLKGSTARIVFNITVRPDTAAPPAITVCFESVFFGKSFPGLNAIRLFEGPHWLVSFRLVLSNQNSPSGGTHASTIFPVFTFHSDCLFGRR
jgi:hypothetical protein